MINIFLFVIASVCLSLYLQITHKFSFGYQAVRTDGPKSHLLTKSKTPTGAGGLLIMLCILTAGKLYAPFVALILFGLIGLVDDALKIKTDKRNTTFAIIGLYVLISLYVTLLNPQQSQILLMILFAWLLSVYLMHDTNTRDMLAKHKLTAQLIAGTITMQMLFPNISLGMLVFGSIFISGVANAVNISDGLDGLITVPLIFAFGYYAYVFNLLPLKIAITVLAAFLLFNWPKAKMFLGDTGSLGFGALLATIAIQTNTITLLIPLGFVFLVNIVSVILQVLSFKFLGKRIFKMAPLHHHFELSGYNERQIVLSIWTMQFIITITMLAIRYFF